MWLGDLKLTVWMLWQGVEIWSGAEIVDQILDMEQEYGLAGESSKSEAGLMVENSMDSGQDVSSAVIQVAPGPSKGFSNNFHVSSGAFVMSNNQNDVVSIHNYSKV